MTITWPMGFQLHRALIPFPCFGIPSPLKDARLDHQSLTQISFRSGIWGLQTSAEILQEKRWSHCIVLVLERKVGHRRKRRRILAVKWKPRLRRCRWNRPHFCSHGPIRRSFPRRRVGVSRRCSRRGGYRHQRGAFRLKTLDIDSWKST